MRIFKYLTKNKLLQNPKVSIIEKIQKVRYYPITKNNNLTLTLTERSQIIVVKKLKIILIRIQFKNLNFQSMIKHKGQMEPKKMRSFINNIFPTTKINKIKHPYNNL